jgi:CheY-like chemotaxis protein
MAPRSVLLIDDNDATRTGLAQLLTLRGYSTREAANGRDGLEWLRRDPSISVIVLDLRMPVADGYWFRQHQSEEPRLAHVPVIVFTGSTEHLTDVEMFRDADVLHKPISVDALLEAIARHCDAGLVS